MEALETYTMPDGNILRIVHDDSATNPYTKWDMLGKLYCVRGARHNTLGADECNNRNECMRDLCRCDIPQYVYLYVAGWAVDDKRAHERLVKAFNAEYDYYSVSFDRYSGRLCWRDAREGWEDGDEFLYCISKADACKAGLKSRKRAMEVLAGELKSISYYAEGSVYGFVIETPDGDHVDSCFGFYGEYGDWEGMGMFDHIPCKRDELEEVE